MPERKAGLLARTCFARWSKEMEERHGITAREAANLLGKTRQSIWRFKNGKATPCETTRLLMGALLSGVRPRPYPLNGGAKIESPTGRQTCGA